MVDIFLFLSAVFLFVFLVGRLLEKIGVPWIFAALIFGVAIAAYNPFSAITSSDTFSFLAQLGMYFLLFMIGLEINVKGMAKKSGFIVRSTILVILFESLAGTLLVHFLFGYDWLISFIVSISFATVGEATLIPILEKFKIVNRGIGQTIIGIGTLDDVVEIAMLILVVTMVGHQINIPLVFAALVALLGMTFFMSKLKRQGHRFTVFGFETTFLISIFVMFLFVGIGEVADAAPLAALMAGIGISTFLPRARLKLIEKEIKAVCYGLFVPIFFIWVGSNIDASYIFMFPVLVAAVVITSVSAKILASYVAVGRKMGLKTAVAMGTGLSVKFSMGIVIIKIMYDSGLVGHDIYSVIVASSIAFAFIVPIVFSEMLSKWGAVLGTSERSGAKKAARPPKAGSA